MHKISLVLSFLLILTSLTHIQNIGAQNVTVRTDRLVYSVGDAVLIETCNQAAPGIKIGLQIEMYTPPGPVMLGAKDTDGGECLSFTYTVTEPGTYTIEVRETWGFTLVATTSFQVTPPGPPFDFTLLLSPTSITVEQGETGTFKVLLTYSDPSYSGTVINIQVTGLGPGMTHQLSPTGDIKITTSSSTSPGTHPITVIGSAQGKTHKTSGTITVTTKAPPFDFSATVSPSTQTVKLGEKATFTVNVGLVSGTGETVALSLAGLPGDIQSSLSMTSGTAPFSSTLTVDTSAATSPGTYTITVTASGAGQTKTASATLSISEESDFSVSVSPLSAEISQGDSAIYTVTINEDGDFDQSVTLVTSGLPSGASPGFSPSSGKPVFTSTLTIDTKESISPGSFTVTIDASGGGKTHSATVTLIVKEKPQEATPSTTMTTAAGEEDEKSDTGSDLSQFLSNPIYLLVIIIAVVGGGLGAALARRRRAPPAPRQTRRISTGFCAHCGEPLTPGVSFCKECGEPVE